MSNRRDTHRSGRLFAEFAERREIGVHLGELGPDALEQAFAGLRRRDAARRPVQQPHPEPFLKIADDLREPRLSHAELGRRTRETALPRHREEGEKIAGVVPVH